MDDIELAIHVAWSRLAPQLAADRAELDRRLARRAKLKLFDHPPRAWCLALRASDTRLPSRIPCGVGASPTHSEDDPVILTRTHLLHLCSPVELTPPGETLANVARKLGVSTSALIHSRVKGLFTERRIRGLGGHAGRPRPLLYTPLPLDPAARGFAPPDPIWSHTAQYLPNRLPRDFEPITLYRTATFGPACTHAALSEPSTLGESNGHAVVDIESLHPEHPRRDRAPDKRKSLALPRRAEAHDARGEEDWVWYKRHPQTGVYLGHDRNNPLAAANHFKKQRELARIRERERQHRREHPKSNGQGSLVFRGWKWFCPTCDRRVNVLYMPVGRALLLAGCELRVADGAGPSELATSNSQLATRQSFACEKCTELRRFSRCDPNAWNEIVTYLSGGLLYGSEVQRPSWLGRAKRTSSPPRPLSPSPPPRDDEREGERETRREGARKIKYTPRPMREPSKRRPQIEAMLLAGMSFKEIATKLGLAKGTVLWTAQQIYKQNGVRTRVELLKKHGITVEDPEQRRREVRRRIQAGQSVPQITEALGVNTMTVYNQRQQMRKRGVKLQDGRKANRVGRKQLSSR